MDPAVATGAVRAPNNFHDGLGERRRVIEAAGDPVERLCLRRQLTSVPSFEFALRERTGRLANFRHTYFGRVRSIDRMNDPKSMLAVVSDFTRGVRLSQLLTPAASQSVTLDINASLHLIRQIVSAVAMLHENAPDVAHGALAPERIVVTSSARIVIVEYVLGAALEQLHYSPARYWKELRIALPPTAEAPSFDHRADVTQIGVVALSLVLGRLLTDDEYPARVGEVLASAWAISGRGGLEPLPGGLRAWLARALQLDPRHSFESAIEASAELDKVLDGEDEGDYEPLTTEVIAAPHPKPVAPESPVADSATNVVQAPVDPADHPRQGSDGQDAGPKDAWDQYAPALAPVAVAPERKPSAVAYAPKPIAVAAPEPKPLAITSEPEPMPVAVTMPMKPVVADAPPQPHAAVELEPLAAPIVPSVAAFAPAVELATPGFHKDDHEAYHHVGEPLDDEQPQPSRLKRLTRLAAAAAALLTLSAAGTYAARRYLATPMPATSPGVLHVVSNPLGVQINVDSETRGTTPLTLTLSAGEHVVQLLADGGVSRTIPVTIAAGALTSQYIEMPAAAAPVATGVAVGSLQIRTEPAGAHVSVDGVARGKAPLLVENLTPGEHAVVLESAFGSVKHTVTVQASTTASLVVPMTAPEGAPVSGWVSLAAPVELELYENKRLLGTSQSDRIMVSAGRHEIEIVNEPLGYRASTVVQVTPGKVTPLKIEWPKGRIALNAVPWAEVWIDGAKAGETPIGNLSLPIGPHEIAFRHPELAEQRHAVTVTLKEPVRLSVDLRKKP